MQLINRKLNADIYDTGNKDAKKRIIKQAVISNGLNSPDLITGEMLPTDKTAKTEINGTSTHAATRCRGKFYIGDKVGAVTRHLCEVRYPNGDGIGVKIQGNNSLSAVNGNKAAFLDDSGTYEIDSEILHHGVRNTIMISDPVNAPNEYILTLKDKGNASYTYEIVNNGIVATDQNGGKPIYFGTPWAVDANGEYAQVQYTLGSKVDNIQTVYKTIDLAWLRSRIGEVKCDPTVTIQDGVGGGVITDVMLVPGGNNWGATNNVQHEDGTGNLKTFLIQVDLSAYAGMTVVSGKWQIYNYVNQGNDNYNVGVYPVLKQWGEGTGNNTAPNVGEATNLAAQHTLVNWTSGSCTGSGTDHNASAFTTFLASSIVINQYNDIVLDPALIQSAWIDGTNYGSVFRDVSLATATPSSTLSYYSSEGTFPPKFVLEYTDGLISNHRNLLLLLNRKKRLRK